MRKMLLALVAALAALAIGVGSATAGSLITSKQVKDHSLKVKDLRKNAVKKLRGQTGPVGATGATGPAGPAGKDGENAVTSVYTKTAAPYALTNGGQHSSTVVCDAGDVAISGGYSYETTKTVVVTTSRQTESEQGWTATFRNDGAGTANVAVYAVCADAA